MKFLGIDYGIKRIGLATSDDSGVMAFPYVVVLNDNSLLKKISEIISLNKIEAIVIGESKDFKMQDNPVMKKILEFKEVLEKDFKLKVILHPELLTSAQAQQIQGKNKMHDASAAAIILQSYLDWKKQNA